MITSLRDRSTYDTVYHNATLVSNWDLLEEIHQTYKRTPVKYPTYQWVRGHQDSTNNARSLPIEAQLNIRADCLAGEYHHIVDRRRHSKTPLMTHTQCILQSKGDSTHAKYTAELRRSIATIEYRAYLTRRHLWPPLAYDTIAWPAFWMAAHTYHSTEVYL
jgi:hypothetical protein